MDSISAITGKTRMVPISQTQDVALVDGKQDVTQVGNEGNKGTVQGTQPIRSTETSYSQSPAARKAEISAMQYQNEISRTRILSTQSGVKSDGLLSFSTTADTKSNGGILGGVKEALIEGSEKKKAYDAKMKELASGELTPAKAIQMQGLTYDNSNTISFMNGLIKRGVTIVQDLTKG